jgi:hypothetical protein
VQQVELDRKVILRDQRVHPAAVLLEQVNLVRRKLRQRAVGGRADLQRALQPIMRQISRPEDLSQLACRMTADQVHLEQAIASRDEALREDEIVQVRSLDGRDAARVASYGYRS